MRERGLSFKQVVNEAIRSGLVTDRARPEREFPSFDMGEPIVDVTRALRLAGELEDQETAARLARGARPVLLVDANVLLHAVNLRAREHEAASAWLASALAGTEAVAFAWTVILAFPRVSTHPAVFPKPLTSSRACEAWLGAPPAVTPEPTRRHLALLRGLLEREGTAGNLVNDAHLAALALEHGATVVSFDRDFARFEGIDLRRPG